MSEHAYQQSRIASGLEPDLLLSPIHGERRARVLSGPSRRAHDLLGRRLRLGDGTFTVRSVTGPSHHDTATLVCTRIEYWTNGNSHGSKSTEDRRKVEVGLVWDALDNGLISEE